MLIGLTGAVGAGKDTVAAMLCGGGYYSVALADALRIEVAAAWRIDPRQLTDRQTKEQPQARLAVGHCENAHWLHMCSLAGHNLMEPRSPRWVLQHWGSFRRAANADHWVQHVRVWIEQQRRHGIRDLVVTDVRYANEAAALRELGGHIVRVHRPDATPLTGDTARHESERHGEIPADADIHNTGTLADLSAEVWRVVLQLADPLTTGA